MTRFSQLLLLCTLAFGLHACDVSDRVAATPQADAVINSLFKARAEHDWQAALSLYDKTFLDGVGVDHWTKQLRHSEQQGSVSKRKKLFFQAEAKINYDTYIYSFKIKRKDHWSKEMITVIKRPEQDRVYILAHLIK